MKLLIRADDLGYSEGINYGIAKSVKDGLIESVGMMPNMPSASHGLDLLEGSDVCLGQHTNICMGRPLTDPSKIPSLVDENGDFKRSKIYRSTQEDFVVLDQVILEIEAQYQQFKKLTGKEPEYFEGHAVFSDNFFRGLEIVADRHGLKYSGFSVDGSPLVINGRKVNVCKMGSTSPGYEAYKALKDEVDKASEMMPNMYICHPGYVDAFILKNSSLTINRAYEVEMLCDPAVKAWLDEKNVERISYRDL